MNAAMMKTIGKQVEQMESDPKSMREMVSAAAARELLTIAAQVLEAAGNDPKAVRFLEQRYDVLQLLHSIPIRSLSRICGTGEMDEDNFFPDERIVAPMNANHAQPVA